MNLGTIICFAIVLFYLVNGEYNHKEKLKEHSEILERIEFRLEEIESVLKSLEAG